MVAVEARGVPPSRDQKVFTMPSLKETLGSGANRKSLLAAAETVLDEEVTDKSGLSGIAIKGAFKLIKGIKPGFIREVIDHLMDDFLDGVDPIYQDAADKDERLEQYLPASSARMADALLSITDARAERAARAVIKKTYKKLRPTAKKHVEASAPRLGKMLDTLLA